MLFMVIETVQNGDTAAVGRRFKEQGRMLPPGVVYHASWLEPQSGRCFQVMESPDRSLLDEWVSHWADLVTFEIIPVVTSSEYWQQKHSQLSGAQPAV